MEEQDLEQLLIVDSEFYDSNAAYVNFFRRRKMTTIKELLDSNITEITQRASYSTRVQLGAFVSMLKHKYFNEPLVYDVFLDGLLQLDMSSGSSYHTISVIDHDGSKKSVNLTRVFGCPMEEIERVFARFENEMTNRQSNREMYNLPTPKIRLIDFFKWDGLERFKVFRNYANAYVEQYEKNMDEPKDETIEDLKNQIASLVATVEHLQYSVEFLQKQIDVLSKEKGGKKR